MKYKPGDKVRIKSFDWYNANKDEDGRVMCDYIGFCKEMAKYCGAVLTIMTIGNQDIGSKQKYFMHETDYAWGFTDDMIEGLVDEEPQEKMVSLEKVEEWLYKNFYESYNLNDYGTYDLDKPYITSLFDTINEMFDDLRKTMEE